jgi:CHAD domain-containing protein
MGYRIKKSKRVADDVRRIVLEQVDKALERLAVKNGKKDDAIHDARVCFKKIRAVLRLMRDQLHDTFCEENTFYRDLGRRLSSVRNDAAMLEAFAKLKERYADQLVPGALSGQRRPFAASNARQDREKSKALHEVECFVRAGRRRIRNWRLGKDGFADLAPGLKRIYRQGRKRFAVATDDPTVENLHEWRKRVKDLWYQTRLLKRVWPAELSKLADELERLGDCLSDDHDLALLREGAAKHAKERKDGGPEVETLVALIDERRSELQMDARLLGERIYAERPAAFVSRLETYWRTWRMESKSKPDAVHTTKPAAVA